MKINFAAMETELEPKWREVFEKASNYATLHNIDTDFADERKSELFDLLITAQNEGSPVRKITGGNTERFCKDFFSDYTPKERLRNLPKVIYRLAVCMLTFLVIDVMYCESFSEITNMRISFLPYICGLGIGIVFEIINIFIISPRMLKSKRADSWSTISLVILVLLIAVNTVIFIKLGLTDTIMEVPILLPLICSSGYIIVYLTVRSVWRYKNYGTVFNAICRPEKEMYQMYRHSQKDAGIEEAVLKGWSAKYRRLSKKGRVTEESFIDKVKSDTALTKKLNKLYYPIYVIIWGGSVTGVALEGSRIYDTMLYAVVCGLILFAVHKYFLRWHFIAEANMERLIGECERSGLTLPKFIEKKQNTWEGI